MRTDSVHLSDLCPWDGKKRNSQSYVGKNYVKTRQFATKPKGAQGSSLKPIRTNIS